MAFILYMYMCTILALYIVDNNGDQLNRCFVQYKFSQMPHTIIQKPHGNSKKSEPFIRTAPSTLQKLKDCSKLQPPKQVIHDITKQKGGIIKAHAVGDIPRNRNQVYNINKNSDKGNDDALLSVMAMCKQSMGKDDDPFVRIVTSAPEPMSVLCTNSQLLDIERFCTDHITCCPLVIDPTFDLGDFHVTVSSYRNLLLTNRKTKKSPVMLGPLLVHRRKLFSSYHFFASSLISLRPSLSRLRAFGTDGEECLYSAFSAEFPQAIHLRCFLHFRDNCKMKLQDMNVPTETITQIIQDIFGSLLKGQMGLVDANDAIELHDKLKAVEDKWEKQAKGFFKWFIDLKLPAIELSMLKPVRQAAGLGNPPGPFYTNDIESINRVIKRKTDYRASEWPDFCRLARELVDEQECELEKAVIGIGEYTFNNEFKHLEIPLSSWSCMTQAQRQKHLNHIRNIMLQAAKIPSTKPVNIISHHQESASSNYLTICEQRFNVDKCQLSNDILKDMFRKAEMLVSAPNSICPSPGSSNAKLVESKSGQRPHYVTKKGSYKYCCDIDCTMWKCSKLCSHTIACAFQDGSLQQFLSQISGPPSLYALSKAGTTSKAGKKPQKRKASAKSTTKLYSEIADITTKPHASASTTDNCSLSTVAVQSQPIKPTGDTSVSSISTQPSAISPSINITQSTPQTTSGGAAINIQSPSICIAQVMPQTSSLFTSTSSSSNNSLAGLQTSSLNNMLATVLTQVLSAPQAQTGVIDPNHLFWVMFVCGNISRCKGCSGRILKAPNNKPLPPPDDLVIQHKEHVLFQNPKSGMFQLSHDLRNVYYHPHMKCIQQVFPLFHPTQHLRISNDILSKLTPEHKQYILNKFSLKL